MARMGRPVLSYMDKKEIVEAYCQRRFNQDLHHVADKLHLPLGELIQQGLTPLVASLLKHEEDVPCTYLENCRCYAHNPSKYLNRVMQAYCSSPELRQFCVRWIQARCLERDAKKESDKK